MTGSQLKRSNVLSNSRSLAALLLSIPTFIALFIMASALVLLEVFSFGTSVIYRIFSIFYSIALFYIRRIGFFRRDSGNILTGFAIPDPYLGYRLKPDIQMDAADPLTELKLGHLHVNRFGYVKNNDDSDDDEAINPEHFVIVVTGGSTAAGIGVHKNSLIFSSILEKRINSHSPLGSVLRQPVQVLNAGQPGHNSSQEMIHMMFDLAFLEPDIWIMFNGINERWYQGEFDGATDWHHHETVVPGAEYAGINVPLGRFLPATRWLAGTLTKGLMPESDAEAVRPGYLNNTLMMRSGAARYCRTIEMASSIAQSQQMGFIHALQPTSGAGTHSFTQREIDVRQHRWSEERWQKYQQDANRFYDEFETEAAKFRSRSKDNGKTVLTNMRHLFDHVDETVYRDPRHYSELGHSMIAEHLFNVIVGRFSDDLYEPARSS